MKEKEVAEREGYRITLVQGDMTKPFPFDDESFDLVFHPVSNCYIEDVYPVWKECYRVLKKGGILLAGLDNGINYAFDEEEKTVVRRLPYNPLKDEELYKESVEKIGEYSFRIPSKSKSEDNYGQALSLRTYIMTPTAKAGFMSIISLPSMQQGR